mgnify:CR=1 FL=1
MSSALTSRLKTLNWSPEAMKLSSHERIWHGLSTMPSILRTSSPWNPTPNTMIDKESKQDKWNRGLDLFIESVLKPDTKLRQCAHNQKCYHELMDVRNDVLEYLKTKRW